MEKMQENKNQQSTQNIQMMTVEPMTDKPHISIVKWSGITTEGDK